MGVVQNFLELLANIFREGECNTSLYSVQYVFEDFLKTVHLKNIYKVIYGFLTSLNVIKIPK